jgi:hypothetical protein
MPKVIHTVHLESFADPKPKGLVFIGPKGGCLRRSNFRKFWYRARGVVGLNQLHLHDLRHTGNTMAAAQGASLKELMERMGHSSPRAVLIYPHATRERDQKIAAGMGKLFTDAQKTSTKKPAETRSGTQRARATVVAGTEEVGLIAHLGKEAELAFCVRADDGDGVVADLGDTCRSRPPCDRVAPDAAFVPEHARRQRTAGPGGSRFRCYPVRDREP